MEKTKETLDDIFAEVRQAHSENTITLELYNIFVDRLKAVCIEKECGLPEVMEAIMKYHPTEGWFVKK